MVSIMRHTSSGRSAGFVRCLAILFAFFASLFSFSACVPSYSSGGAGPARNLFSHAAYHFALANTTTTAASSRNRTMGMVRLESEEMRARLPQDAGNVTVTYRLLPGDNELVTTFFEVNASSGRLLFKSEWARDFSLGYVVHALGVREFDVAADISYLNTDGERQHWDSVSVPVRISATARALEAADFVIFNGFTRARTERVTFLIDANNRSFEGRVELGFHRISPFFLQSNKFRRFSTLFINTARSVVDPTEIISYPDLWDSEGMGENITSRLNQALNISVLLLLTKNGENHRNLSLTYPAANGISQELLDDIHTREGSLRHFVAAHPDVISAQEDIFNLDPSAKSGFGADLEAIRFAFPFFYQREVGQTEERLVERRRHYYELQGALDENASPRSVVSRVGDLFDTLGIYPDLSKEVRAQTGLDRPPTLYFRLQSGFDRSGESAYCSGRFYLDNQGYRILLGSEADADFEVNDLYVCKVQVSLTGLSDDYTDVTTGILGDVPERYDRMSLFFGQVARTNPPVPQACEGSILGTAPEFGQCNYRTRVYIFIRDRNEPPVLRIDEATRVNFTYEGDTGMADILGVLPVGGKLPPARHNETIFLASFEYEDEDRSTTGNIRGPLLTRAPEIVSVVPSAPAGLFYLKLAENERSGVLYLNGSMSSAIDYEGLPADTDTGYRGYRITLSVRDNSTSALETRQTLDLEVRDLAYAPTNLAYMRSSGGNVSERLPAGDGLAETQVLLPSFAQFVANGGPVLGRLTGLDPESGRGTEITFRYGGVILHPAVTSALSSSVASGLAARIGRQFEVSGSELRLGGLDLRVLSAYVPGMPGLSDLPYDFGIRVTAYREGSPQAAANVTVQTRVAAEVTTADDAFDLGELPASFERGLLLGSVAEGDAVGVAVLAADETTLRPVSPPAPLLLSAWTTQSAASVAAGNTLVYDLMAAAELREFIGFIGRTDAARAAALNAVFGGERFRRADAEAFELNAANGALSLREGVMVNFGVQSVYTLLVRVTDDAREAAEDSGYLHSDYALVRVVVADRNAAPRITALRAASVPGGDVDVRPSVGAGTAAVLARLPENTAAGTRLATFMLRDDNRPPAESVFVATNDSDGGFVLASLGEPSRDAVSGEWLTPYAVSLAVSPDYEADATLTATQRWTDGGVYRVLPLATGSEMLPLAGSVRLSAELDLAVEVANMNEAIAVNVTRDAAASVLLQSELLLPEDRGLGLIEGLYVHLDDPESRLSVARPRVSLETEPASLRDALDLVFTSAGEDAFYYRLNVADAAALENAGDGRLFTVTVRVWENGTGLASESVSFAIRVEDVVYRPVVPDLGVVRISEQLGLDAIASPGLGILLEGMFDVAALQPDYDEFFPGTDVRLADVEAVVRPVTFEESVFGERLHREELFGLFALVPSVGGVGVDLRLDEGRLIERNFLGDVLGLPILLRDPSDTVAAAAEHSVTTQVRVEVLAPPAAEALAFADREGRVLRPAAYTLLYEQSAYEKELAGAACAGGEVSAVPDVPAVRVDGRCYPARLLRGPSGDLTAVARRSDEQTGLMDGDGAALVAVDGRAVGFRLSGPAVNVSAVRVSRLDSAGRLTVAGAYFEDYFEWEFNASYRVGADAAPVTALVLRPKFYPVRNVSAGADAVIAGAVYPALDTLSLSLNRPAETLSYFVEVFVGEGEGENRTDASRRALGQMNVRVNRANLNEPAFVSSLSLGDVFLSNETVTDVDANQFALAVNNLSEILSFTVVNPDAADASDGAQRTEIHLEVIANASAAADVPKFNLQSGFATGSELIRLGVAADAVHRVSLGSGQVRHNSTGHGFQMARNLHGEAVIQVTLREFVDGDAMYPHAPVVEYYRIRVNPVANRVPAVPGPLLLVANRSASNVFIGSDRRAAIDENHPDLAGLFNFQFVVRDADFLEPVRQQLLLTGTRAVLVPASPRIFIGMPSRATALSQNGSSAEVLVTQGGYRHQPDSFGVATFNLELTETEPRGFTDRNFTYAAQPVIAKMFSVRSENDRLLVCPSGGGAPCAPGSVRRGAAYRLQEDFGTSALAATGTVRRSAMVFVHDADLSFEPNAHPTVRMLRNHRLTLNNGRSTTNIAHHLTLNPTGITFTPVAGTNELRVELPLDLRMSPELYTELNRGDGGSVEFDVVFEDFQASRVTATARVTVRISATTTDDDNDGVNDLATDGTQLDACPRGETGWRSNRTTDHDGDGCRDADEDPDDDNNGLIEIRTLDDLARLRDDLNGDGADDNRTDEITAVGSAGCPSSGCLGYELTRSLNFSLAASYGSNGENSGKQSTWTDRDGSGWVPIGFCTSNNVCTAYTGVFDGRDHTIADLFVSAHHDAIGVGLFGAFNGSLQNLHLRNARVSGGANDVGTLVGNGRNAGYENLSVTGGSVMSPSAGNVGGLVGEAARADIRYASVSGGDVSGNVTVGGLVGKGREVDIRYAYVSGVNVSGKFDNVGGLVGKGREVDIRYAYVSGVDVSGNVTVGGLVGDGYRSDIRYAYVLGGSVAGDDEVGGLVGIGGGQDGQIYYSYVAAGFVLGSGGDIGGLIGIADAQITVNASYWDTETTGQLTSAGGDGQSTVQLQGASFTGIYALWGNFWCNPNTGEETESTSQPIGFVRVWDLGESSQYPALNCMPGGLSAQGR